MNESVERTSLDLRYEGYRMRSPAGEAQLLASIAERGIEQPLEGVDTPQGRFLLNGFKRYRCARKLGISGIETPRLPRRLPSRDKATSQQRSAVRFLEASNSRYWTSFPSIA